MPIYTIDYGVMLMTAEHHINIAKAQIHDLDVECHTQVEHAGNDNEVAKKIIAQYATLKAAKIRALVQELDKILIQ